MIDRFAHPLLVSSALAAARDACLTGQNFAAAYRQFRDASRAATRRGELPPGFMDLQQFRWVWNSAARFQDDLNLNPLDFAALAKIDLLPAATGGRGPLVVTAIRDLATNCLTGVHVHVGNDDIAEVSRALVRSISAKHAAGMRLPGCVNAWPCEGAPYFLEAAPSLAETPSRLTDLCDSINIIVSPEAVDRAPQWSQIETLFRQTLCGRCDTSNPAAMERLLTIAAVDDWNQRSLDGGASPHERWLTGRKGRT
jgi:hypothetical protein